MPEFMADLLPGVLVTQSLAAIELSFIRATRRRRFPPHQHLMPHLRVPMPQPVHVAQVCRLALSVVNVAGAVGLHRRAGAVGKSGDRCWFGVMVVFSVSG